MSHCLWGTKVNSFPLKDLAGYLVKYHCSVPVCPAGYQWATGIPLQDDAREVPGEVPVEVPALSLVVWYWVVAGWKPPLDSAGAAQTLAPTSPHSSLQQPAGPSSSQMWPKRAKVAEMGQKLSSVKCCQRVVSWHTMAPTQWSRFPSQQTCSPPADEQRVTFRIRANP